MKPLFILFLPLITIAQPKKLTAIQVQYAIPKKGTNIYQMLPPGPCNANAVFSDGCVTVGTTQYDVDSVTYIYSLPFRQAKYYLKYNRHPVMARIYTQSFDGIWYVWFRFGDNLMNATHYTMKEEF